MIHEEQLDSYENRKNFEKQIESLKKKNSETKSELETLTSKLKEQKEIETEFFRSCEKVSELQMECANLSKNLAKAENSRKKTEKRLNQKMTELSEMKEGNKKVQKQLREVEELRLANDKKIEKMEIDNSGMKRKIEIQRLEFQEKIGEIVNMTNDLKASNKKLETIQCEKNNLEKSILISDQEKLELWQQIEKHENSIEKMQENIRLLENKEAELKKEVLKEQKEKSELILKSEKSELEFKQKLEEVCEQKRNPEKNCLVLMKEQAEKEEKMLQIEIALETRENEISLLKEKLSEINDEMFQQKERTRVVVMKIKEARNFDYSEEALRMLVESSTTSDSIVASILEDISELLINTKKRVEESDRKNFSLEKKLIEFDESEKQLKNGILEAKEQQVRQENKINDLSIALSTMEKVKRLIENEKTSLLETNKTLVIETEKLKKEIADQNSPDKDGTNTQKLNFFTEKIKVYQDKKEEKTDKMTIEIEKMIKTLGEMTMITKTVEGTKKVIREQSKPLIKKKSVTMFDRIKSLLRKDDKKVYVVNLEDHKDGDFEYDKVTKKWVNKSDKEPDGFEDSLKLPPKKLNVASINIDLPQKTTFDRYAYAGESFGFGDKTPKDSSSENGNLEGSKTVKESKERSDDMAILIRKMTQSTDFLNTLLIDFKNMKLLDEALVPIDQELDGKNGDEMGKQQADSEDDQTMTIVRKQMIDKWQIKGNYSGVLANSLNEFRDNQVLFRKTLEEAKYDLRDLKHLISTPLQQNVITKAFKSKKRGSYISNKLSYFLALSVLLLIIAIIMGNSYLDQKLGLSEFLMEMGILVENLFYRLRRRFIGKIIS